MSAISRSPFKGRTEGKEKKESVKGKPGADEAAGGETSGGGGVDVSIEEGEEPASPAKGKPGLKKTEAAVSGGGPAGGA